MGSVHLGRLVGPVGFSRIVAIKRLHPAYAKEPEFVAMFLDEARLAARVRHPNVVSTLEVVAEEGEAFLVMDYVEGDSLSHLVKVAAARGERVPLPVASAIAVGLLTGLHAAHHARNEAGEPLEIVHRDVSPQNVIVGTDGVPRVVDFGVAKAAGRVQTTRDGQIKGKAAYMAPEQLRGRNVDARADVYGAAVVIWEMLTGARLFQGATPEETVIQILERDTPKPSELRPEVPSALDTAVLRGLERDAEARFASARDMALAIEDAVAPATQRAVAEWVEAHLDSEQKRRAERVAHIEADPEPLTPATLTKSVAVAERIEPTSISRISVATKRVEDAKERKTPVLAILGIAAVLGLVVTVGWKLTRAPESAAGAPVVATVSETATAAPTATATPTATASATASAMPSASASPPATTTVRRVKKNCKPPWKLDQNGFRIPKPECF
jgi:serine/threonine-protein kinase